VHVSRLPDTVAPVLCLRIHRRIPIAIVEDDRVGPGQVDAHPAGAGAQDEAEILGVVVEPFHEQLAHLHLGGAVQPHVDVAVVVEEGLQDVQHAGHLGEDEHTMAADMKVSVRLKIFQVCYWGFQNFFSGSSKKIIANPGLVPDRDPASDLDLNFILDEDLIQNLGPTLIPNSSLKTFELRLALG
jgi:hypothetical protein